LGKSIVFFGEVESPRTPEGGLSTKVSVYQLWGVSKMFFAWVFANSLLCGRLQNIFV